MASLYTILLTVGDGDVIFFVLCKKNDKKKPTSFALVGFLWE